MKRYERISKEFQKWSETQKEAFLEDERKDARLYTVFFSLFGSLSFIGLHSLIVGTDLYPSQDINAFLFTFTPYPDIVVMLFAILGVLNIFCVLTRLQIHDRITERHIPLDQRITFYLRSNKSFRILLVTTFFMDIFIFIVFSLLTHVIVFLVVLIVTIFVYMWWRVVHRRLRSILEE
ncbi:MAG: hypothetical protein ACXACR_13110 [Candidatus Hodarchaeales archaeon]|jgi:hypothetical protein